MRKNLPGERINAFCMNEERGRTIGATKGNKVLRIRGGLGSFSWRDREHAHIGGKVAVV